MYTKEIRELHEEASKLHHDMAAQVTAAHKEGRELTGEENEKWEAMDARFEACQAEIRRLRKLAEQAGQINQLDTRMAGRQNHGEPGTPVPTADMTAEQRTALQARQTRAWGAWLRRPVADLSQEDRELLNGMQAELPDSPELRAMGLTGSAGGYMIPQDFMNEVEVAELAYSPMRRLARVVPTTSGATMPWPMVNDTGNSAVILAEGNAAAEDTDPTYAVKNLGAYVYTSKVIRVANQLVQDTAFPLEAHLQGILAERMGRGTGAHYTTGTGSGQPLGVITAVQSGGIEAAASATAIAYADIVDLETKLDPAYIEQGPRFMFHNNVLAAAKKLVDGASRIIWGSGGLEAATPPTIHGYPYTVNQAMSSTITANDKTMAFGLLNKYVIRDVVPPVLLVLRERYAEYFQTGYVMFARHDGLLGDAGTHPVVILQQAAS